MNEPVLSPEELRVLCDNTFMPLKKRVSDHVVSQLEQLRKVLKQEILLSGQFSSIELKNPAGKISRGENYNTYAFRVLDFPGIFDGDEMFLFRTMMLWGHHFASYLILSGKWQTHYRSSLLEKFDQLATQGFLIFDHATPWEWEIEPPGAIPLTSLTPTAFHSLLEQKPFIKLGRKLALEKYQDLIPFSLESWKLLMEKD